VNSDIVYIGTTPTSHRVLALEAFAAKKHVLLEKPVACKPHSFSQHSPRLPRGSGVERVECESLHVTACFDLHICVLEWVQVYVGWTLLVVRRPRSHPGPEAAALKHLRLYRGALGLALPVINSARSCPTMIFPSGSDAYEKVNVTILGTRHYLGYTSQQPSTSALVGAIGHNYLRPLAASKEDADAIVAAAEAAVSLFAIPMRFPCDSHAFPTKSRFRLSHLISTSDSSNFPFPLAWTI
jgi:hypothetical protein